MVFSQSVGAEKVWVPGGEESEWIARFQGWGMMACTVHEYRRWGGFFPRFAEAADSKALRRHRRKRTNYAHWTAP